jgi:hypothetical protein
MKVAVAFDVPSSNKLGTTIALRGRSFLRQDDGVGGAPHRTTLPGWFIEERIIFSAGRQQTAALMRSQ